MKSLGQTAYEAWLKESIRRGFLSEGKTWDILAPEIQDIWDHIANVVATRVKASS